MFVNADALKFDSAEFTMGGGADSTYEYLPKEHILLGAQTDQYRNMYIQAMESIKSNLLFRAMTKEEDQKLLFTSELRMMNGGGRRFVNHVQDHLKCFLGGTVAISAKIFNRPDDLSLARGLTDGCVWAYDQMPTGIMPEAFKFIPCEDIDHCPWDESRWYEEIWGQPLNSNEHLERVRELVDKEGLAPGMTGFKDPSYKLRYDMTPNNADVGKY